MSLLMLVALALAAPAPQAAHRGTRDTLTVVTLNLWHDQHDWPRRLTRIVAGLRALHPDVVCLQEVLQHATLPNQAQTLADSLGYGWHFVSVDSVNRVKRYGNAILTPHRILHVGGRKLLPLDDYRVAAHVRLEFRGRVIDVYDTHLHHTLEGAAIRATQIRDLLGFIDTTRARGALVLAGDFNATPQTAELQLLAPAFLDVYTATNPDRTGLEAATMNPALGNAPAWIDHIFVAREAAIPLTPLSAEVIFRDCGPDSVWASDHFGVLARLGVGGKPRRGARPR